MKKIILYPHPNYIKVVHSYIWFGYLFLAMGCYFFIENSLTAFVLILALLSIPLLIIHRFVNRFMNASYAFTRQNNQLFFSGTPINPDDLRFSSFLLENAYGVGTLSLPHLRIRGVSFEDYQQLRRFK